MKRVTYLILTIALFGLSAGPQAQKPAAAKPAAPASQVYLTPTCGCCSKWVDHMKAAGFDMERSVMPQEELDKVAPRQKVPVNLRSCHTAVVGKYVVEGHVPADVVQKLLKEGPAIVGISAPNMPAGSPGMESPNARPYPIVAFKADGSTYEYARAEPRAK